MSHSITSLSEHSESTTSLTINPNESTAELIPKTLASESAPTVPTSATPPAPSTSSAASTATKDWEKAYGELASSMGFAGAVPQLPQTKGKAKTTVKKKASQKGDSSSSSGGLASTTAGSSQGASTRK